MPLYDCTHRIETGMPTYPGDPDVSRSPHATHEADGYEVTALELGSHAGTHVDAPRHTEPDGRTLGAYDVERFRFDARLVDCRDVGAREAIPPDAVPETDAELLAFRTGWDDHWGTGRYLDHPYLAPATARRCAEAAHHVATDTLNPDPTPTERATPDEPSGVPAHRALLGAGRFVVENLTGLERLPERVTLHAYPLAVDADGAPIRAVAEVDGDREPAADRGSDAPRDETAGG
ncbi:cyclase family protein [Halorubrum halodurans]|uniref:Cyclase n=1 Tax=Halorubrum halodurans TaxID=1383851 RepID=A0A256IB34_9EURY|nr:cyclase family protein [Halorubrum halodurans]OYR53758.1 cyclase [Halorubrum halodurans]